jgi:hypothetical protein
MCSEIFRHCHLATISYGAILSIVCASGWMMRVTGEKLVCKEVSVYTYTCMCAKLLFRGRHLITDSIPYGPKLSAVQSSQRPCISWSPKRYLQYHDCSIRIRCS